MKLLLAGILTLCASVGVSCHKSGASDTLSGTYVESTPKAGGSTLNFITRSTVIATGAGFFLEQLSAPDTLNYFVSSDEAGPLISFVVNDGASRDTVSLNYKVSGVGILSLSFKPCPPGAYCGAFAGSVWIYKK